MPPQSNRMPPLAPRLAPLHAHPLAQARTQVLHALTHACRAALACLVGALAGMAHAAEPVGLSVRGVIRPASCDVILSDGAVADFGVISTHLLRATEVTVLPPQVVTLTITCDSPAKIGVTTIDNRAGTVNAAASAKLLATAGYTFGVGSVGGRKVGAYTLMTGTSEGMRATADGNDVSSIYSQDGGAVWFAAQQGPAQPGVRLHSWSPLGTTVPGAYKLIHQPIKVSLALASIVDLPALTDDVVIDGLATITLRYL